MSFFNLLFKYLKRPKSLTYPEQPKDESQTLSFDTEALVDDWLREYGVKDKSFWYDVDIEMSMRYYPSPAATDSANKKMWIVPGWGNTGVLAHEMAHISWYQLSQRLKEDYELLYNALKSYDEWLKLLLKERPNTDYSGIVEIHAEVFRFLNENMPEPLKPYYPHLS